MSTSLYELGQAYEQLLEMVENEQLSDEEVADTFEAIHGAIEQKIDNIGGLFRQWSVDEANIKTEIDRLAARKKQLQNRKDRLRNIIHQYLKMCGKKRVEGSIFTAAIRNNPPALVVSDEADIPENFYKIEKKLDQKALKEAVQNGMEIAGVNIEQSERVDVK